MKKIYQILTYSRQKSLLFALLGMLTIFIFGADFFSYIQLQENEKTLQNLEIEKEKILIKRMEKSPEQFCINQLVLLNRSNAGFTIANLCEISKTWLTKIKLEKSRKKITENTFKVSLDLMSDYPAFLTFIEKLSELPWKIYWETINITLKNSKKTKINIEYPLQIKIQLAIENYYLPNKKTAKKLNETASSKQEDSPFLIRRYAGKLIYNQKSFDIIDIGHVSLKTVISTTPSIYENTTQ